MLLVLPISLSDQKFLSQVERAFETFPPGSGHKILAIGSPNVSGQVKEAAQSLCGHFAGNASTYEFDLDCDLGWPTACNYYFQQAAWHVGANYDEPWLWYEIDTTPTRAGWLDEIDNEVHRLKAQAQAEGIRVPRYFGVEEAACLEYQGALMPETGTQMAAVGVYPSNMDDVLSLRAISSTNIVWNTFLRWYVMLFFAGTPLFQNNWRTVKYRLNGSSGAIESDSIANWAWDVHFNKPVYPQAALSPQAALVHGCKDGTLLDILIEAQKPESPESSYWTDPPKEPEPVHEEKVVKKEPRPIPASYRRR